MHSRRRRAWSAGLLLAVALTAAGCSADDRAQDEKLPCGSQSTSNRGVSVDCGDLEPTPPVQ